MEVFMKQSGLWSSAGKCGWFPGCGRCDTVGRSNTVHHDAQRSLSFHNRIGVDSKGEVPSPLESIAAQFRRDKNLPPEGKKAIEATLKAMYQNFSRATHK